jgi:protein-disulfide isomerase
MDKRMIVILAALALVMGCDKGGKKESQGKPVAVAKPAAKPEKAPAKPAPARAGNNVVTDRGIRVEKVKPSDVPARFKRRAPRPTSAKKKKVDPETAAKAAKIALPAKGSKTPKVEIIEVSDFQCPYCRRVNPTMKKLLATYGKDVRVRFLHQPLPFHREAKKAAVASAAAGMQGKFWPYHDKLFANQRALKPSQLEQYAKELAASDSAFSFAKWKTDFNNPVMDAFVDRNQATAIAVRATGTPMFFVNGKTLRGAQPYPKFEAIVKAEIAAAGKRSGQRWITARTKTNNAALASYVYEGKNPPAAPARRAKSNKRKPREDLATYKVSIDLKKDAIKGNKRTALVTLVEFSEFQCPFCSKVNPRISQVMKEYGQKVRVIFKHNPLSFHKDAFPAAEASLCAKDQGKFWDYHDKLFSNQRQLKAEHLDKYATDLKLDMDKFKTCMSSHKHKAQIKADQSLAGKVTARGTPNIFINGRKLTGARPYADFKKIIDEKLIQAEGLIKKGIPAAQVYNEVIKNGKILEPLGSASVEIPVGDSARLGSPKAPVVITEFSDFQCGYCSRVGAPLKQVKEHYGNKVVVVFKNFPLSFHKEAKPAAIAALCANAQGKFWEYHDTLFAKQRELRGAKQDKFVGFAKAIGVKNIAKFTTCLSDPKVAQQVAKETAEGRKIGVRGTPSVYINGRKFSPMGTGFSLRAFKSIIDNQILKKK